MVCSNKPPLWHSYTYTIHLGIFCPPQLRDGDFLTSDMTSTLFQMPCDIRSTLLWSKMWKHLMKFLDILVMSRGCYVKCGCLSHFFWPHLWCPAGCEVWCGRFVTWFLDIPAMSNQLTSKMWTFCHKMFGHNMCWHPDFWTHLWWPTGC